MDTSLSKLGQITTMEDFQAAAKGIVSYLSETRESAPRMGTSIAFEAYINTNMLLAAMWGYVVTLEADNQEYASQVRRTIDGIKQMLHHTLSAIDTDNELHLRR